MSVFGFDTKLYCICCHNACIESSWWWTKVESGSPLPPEYSQENLPLLERGTQNLIQHIENAQYFGVPQLIDLSH